LIRRRSKNNPSVLTLSGLEVITLSTPDDFTLRHKNGTLIIDGGRQLRLAIINITATNITDQDNRFTWIPFTFEGSTNEHQILAAGGDPADWQPLLDDPDTYLINRVYLAYEKAANDIKRAHYIEFASDNDSDVEEQRMAVRNQRILKQKQDDDYIDAAATIALEKASESNIAPLSTAINSTNTPSPSSKEAPPAGETTPPNGNTSSDVKDKSDSSKANDQDSKRTGRGRGKRNHNRNDDENLGAPAKNNYDNYSSSSSSVRGGGSSGRRGRGGRRQYRSRSRSPQRYNHRRRYQDYDRGYQERERSPYYQRHNRDRDDYGSRRSDSSRDYRRDNEPARSRNDRDRNDGISHSRTHQDAREKSPVRKNDSTSPPTRAGAENNTTTTAAATTAPTVGFQSHGLLNSFMPNGSGIPALPFMAPAPTTTWPNMQPFHQFGQQQHQHSLQQLHLPGQWHANTAPNNLPFPPPPGAWNGGFAPSMPPPQWSNNMTPYNLHPSPFNANSTSQLQLGGSGINTLHSQPQQQQQHQQQHFQHYPGVTSRTQGGVLGDDPEVQFITNTGMKKGLRNSLFRYESRR
jgi:hypothetical protein